MKLPVKNPYSHWANLTREIGSMDNPPGIFKGTVISTSKLTISSGEQQIDADNILISYGLVLNIGDNVAVMPSSDNQTYFVLCKVVSP